MTTEPDAAAGGDPASAAAMGADRRLHPMSWLFVLLAQLRQFIVPLLALFVFGRGDRNELWPLVGVAALALASVWRYFTYRYGIGSDRLVVRSGLLERSLRVIPFARIHNVALQQSLLHRLFGVAEVRLESAGGTRPEAEMRVLRLDDALALEQLIRRGGTAGTAADAVPDAPEAATLLALPTGEVLRLGLVSNRGLVVVGAAMAALYQFAPGGFRPDRLLGGWAREAFGWAGHQQLGIAGYALAALAVFLSAALALRLLSTALALLQYHGFVLQRTGRRLTAVRGLLGRWRTSVARGRIQAWTLREGVIHRLLRRRSLEVDIAAARDPDAGGPRALHELAPIAPAASCDALVAGLLPRSRWPALDWQPLPRRSWWRRLLPTLPWVALGALGLGWRFGPWGLLVLAWLPLAAVRAWQEARHAAWALDDELVAVREGWWDRSWRFAQIDKLQALQLLRSPLDRRCGTATVWLDTAGAAPMGPPLRIRFLPLPRARALHDRLARELARRPLRW